MGFYLSLRPRFESAAQDIPGTADCSGTESADCIADWFASSESDVVVVAVDAAVAEPVAEIVGATFRWAFGDSGQGFARAAAAAAAKWRTASEPHAAVEVLDVAVGSLVVAYLVNLVEPSDL